MDDVDGVCDLIGNAMVLLTSVSADTVTCTGSFTKSWQLACYQVPRVPKPKGDVIYKRLQTIASKNKIFFVVAQRLHGNEDMTI